MTDSPKYLVHAAFRASGVVERNDVVGAVFGQTEGLLGEDLDLRDLQQSSKVGRIDVSLGTEAGRTYGTLTIASGLDRVETAILAAALETIERVGPARAQFEIESIEDAREAKRREVVDRATELLADLEAETATSRDLVEAVRERVRVADITEYEGLPAGPQVADSDNLVIVEGRADVLTLLRYGVRNAIAAEGTDVPESLADLTAERTTTAFLDGDRGGDLICRELAQVADVDYVTFAPEGMAVEDLDRAAVTAALRRKALLSDVADSPSPREAFYGRSPMAGASVGEPESAASADGQDGGEPAAGADVEQAAGDGGETGTGDGDAAAATGDEAADPVADDDDAGRPEVPTAGAGSQVSVADRVADVVEAGGPATEPEAVDTGAEATDGPGATEVAEAGNAAGVTGDGDVATAVEEGTADTAEDAAAAEDESRESTARSEPETLAGHVAAVVGQGTETVRFLDADLEVLDTAPASEALETLESAETVPRTVVLDGELTQALLDVAAQRGVGQVVARTEGEFVKRPTAVRTRLAAEF